MLPPATCWRSPRGSKTSTCSRPSFRAERPVVQCVPEAIMSARNGEKARAAIEKSNRTARRVKNRAARARASQQTTESSTPKARKS